MRRLAAALIFLVTWGLTTHGKYSVTGDEPHYLMVAESLRTDADIAVGNNYANGDGAMFGAAGLVLEQHVRQAADGRLLPVHDVGVPIVLTPVYAAARALSAVPGDDLLRRMRMNRGLFAYSLISLTILALCTVAAVLTAGALRTVGASDRVAAAIVAIAWLSPPVLSNAFLVFPEPFALLITACVVARGVDRDAAWQPADCAVVALLGAMPWLHRKFAFYAIALLAVLLWQRKAALQQHATSRRLAVVAVFAVLPLLQIVWTWYEWGNVAGPLAIERLPFSFGAFTRGVAGGLVDRENGLVWWAPAYALLPAAFWLRRRELWLWLLPVIALIVPNAAHDQWWGGFSPAGRFLVPLAPILCLFSVELARNRFLRLLAVPLLTLQAIAVAYAWQHPRLLWPQGDGENRVLAILLPPLGHAYRFIPSLRTAVDDAALSRAMLLLVALAALNVAAVLICRSMDGMIVGSRYAPSRYRRSP